MLRIIAVLNQVIQSSEIIASAHDLFHISRCLPAKLFRIHSFAHHTCNAVLMTFPLLIISIKIRELVFILSSPSQRLSLLNDNLS